MISGDIVFKGTKDGVIIRINSLKNFESIKDAIECQISKSRDFFKNGKLYMDFDNAGIDEEHKEEIEKLIYKNYGIYIQSIEKNRNKTFKGIYDGRTKFINNTIRSGQNLEFVGNVVVIGDVNAGAHVNAGGNIAVLGSLRGMAHAGASGNERAIIAAFSLQPTQLRIANIISRPPDGESLKPRCPELAMIKEGSIIIEPYAPNKFI